MTTFSMTYQELQEITSPGLVIALFSWRSGKHLALFPEAHDNEMVDVRHILWFGMGLGVSTTF